MRYKVTLPVSNALPTKADGTPNPLFTEWVLLFLAYGGTPQWKTDHVLYDRIPDYRTIPFPTFQQIIADGGDVKDFPIWIKVPKDSLDMNVPLEIKGSTRIPPGAGGQGSQRVSWRNWLGRNQVPVTFGDYAYIHGYAHDGEALSGEEVLLLMQQPGEYEIVDTTTKNAEFEAWHSAEQERLANG